MGTAQLVFLSFTQSDPLGDDFAGERALRLRTMVRSLWKEHKALLYGELDGAGARRALVVLDVPNKTAAEALLTRDPDFASGKVTTECLTWYFGKNYVVPGPRFDDFDAYWFGLLVRPKDAPKSTPEESGRIQAGHMANIQKMAASGALLIAGPFDGAGAKRGVFVFKAMPQRDVVDLVSRDPAIQSGHLCLQLFRWHATRGSFLLERR